MAVIDEHTFRAAAVGSVVTVYGGRVADIGASWPIVALGIVVWGLGASLGFPVGMSAAADDPVRAAARVSVVSTIRWPAMKGVVATIMARSQDAGLRA